MPDSRPRKAGRPSNPIPREKLLRAAISAFADEGYAGASLDRIADDSGIRKSSLIHRFGNKEALYLESISTVLGNLGSMVSEAASSAGGFVDRLDQLSGVITEYLGAEPRAARLLFREVMDRGPFFSGPGGALFQEILGTAVLFVDAGDAAGEFEVSDPHDLVLSIVGVHLAYFAIHELSESTQGKPVFEPESLKRRKREVTAQVRRLCGVDVSR